MFHYIHQKPTSVHKVIHIPLCWIVAPFYEKFFHLLSEEALVCNLFCVGRDYVIEGTACNSSITWSVISYFRLAKLSQQEFVSSLLYLTALFCIWRKWVHLSVTDCFHDIQFSYIRQSVNYKWVGVNLNAYFAYVCPQVGL